VNIHKARSNFISLRKRFRLQRFFELSKMKPFSGRMDFNAATRESLQLRGLAMRGSQVENLKFEIRNLKFGCIASGCSFLKGLTLVFAVLLLCMSIGCQSPNKSPSKVTKADLLYQLERKFENPDAHCKLGDLYCDEGQYAKAEYHFNTALAFDPVHRPTQAAMVKMFAKRGDKAKAQLYADMYIKQAAGSVSQLLQLGQAFQRQDSDEYALTCYQQALALSPDSAEANKHIGFYYVGKADKARAQEYLTRSFQANPNQPDVALELGRLGVVVETPRLPEKIRPKSAESSGQPAAGGSGKGPPGEPQEGKPPNKFGG
jgi:tetratricopeptide (TPR) repeat protein